MRIRNYFLIALASAAVFVSCQEQVVGTEPVGGRGALDVSFRAGSALTKASSAFRHAAYDLEGTDLELSETVEKIRDYVDTKGSPVYTENIAGLYPSLATTAYNVKDFSLWGPVDVEFKSNESGVYSHNYSSGSEPNNLSWPDDGKTDLRFFVRAPYFASADPCENLSYSLKSDSALAEFSYTTPETAAAQKDILFGSGRLSFETKSSSDNQIELYHVLTGVKFKVADKVIEDNIVVTKVEFTGVVSKANCQVETFLSGKNSEEVVSWTIGGTPVTGNFSQEFDGLVTATGEEGFAESFYKDDVAKNNLNDADFSLMFWFIPQSLDKVSAKITYTINGGNPQTGTASFGTGKSWNAGEIHTYTLSLKGAGLSITDDVEGQVKSNVVITNTGNMPEYIRVAVVANWVKADGTSVGTMIPTLQLGANWVKSGAYYYYKNVVNPGMQPGQADASDTTVDKFFDTYEVPVSEAPEGADHLEMGIAVQAIDSQAQTDYKEAWKKAGVEVK